MSEVPSPLLQAHLPSLVQAARLGPILDLACGGGRNGGYLVANGLPVVFADNSPSALARVQRTIADSTHALGRSLASLWPVDIEAPVSPLAGRRFGAIIVFRYLYRAAMSDIAQAVHPGGLVIYETFTVDQPAFGRPNNPDYLLRPGELRGYFPGWEILHWFEGVKSGDTGVGQQAVAQIVARKSAQ